MLDAFAVSYSIKELSNKNIILQLAFINVFDIIQHNEAKG